MKKKQIGWYLIFGGLLIFTLKFVFCINNLVKIARSRSQEKFRFGNPGTLFLHTFLTDILKNLSEDNISCGFNGIMYSLLEDTGLAEYYSDNIISNKDLFYLSCTCACGLDMIPLSKDTTREEVDGYLLDVFSMSSILAGFVK